MAVTTLSPGITNFVNGSSISNDLAFNAKSQKIIDGIALTSAKQAVNSIIALGVIDSGAVLEECKFYNDSALDTNVSPALAVDLGLYTMDNQGNLTVVSGAGACYASAVTVLQGANTTGVDLISGSAITAALRATPAYSVAGVSIDPVKQYVLGLKIHTAAGTAAASVPTSWKISIIKN